MKRSFAAAVGALALFHGWIFGNQLWAGQLSEPGLIARWLLAAGLVAGMVALARSGESLFWGRKTVSIWLLAALLHGPAMADGRASALDQPSLPEAATVVLQLVTVALAGLGLALAARLQSNVAVVLSQRAFVPSGPHDARDFRQSWRLAPRPPPQLL